MILSWINSQITGSSLSIPANSYEYSGQLFVNVVWIILAIWIIYEGIKARKRTKGNSIKKQKNGVLFQSLQKLLKRYVSRHEDLFTSELENTKPAIYHILIWILGVGFFIDRMSVYAVSWVELWIGAIVFGWVFGFIMYYLFGSLIHLIVRIAGGKKGIQTSRNIYLYGFLPLAVTLLLIYIFDTIFYGQQYFSGAISGSVEQTSMILVILASFYSIFLTYKGVLILKKPNKTIAIVLLLILPILLRGILIYNVYANPRYNSDIGVDTNNRAMELMNDSNFAEAETLLHGIIDEYGTKTANNYAIQQNLAEVLRVQGKSNEAIKAYQDSAIGLLLESVEYKVVLGQVALLQGEVDTAIFNFERALDVDTNNLDARNYLASIYMGGEGYEEVMDWEKATMHNFELYQATGSLDNLNNLAIGYYNLDMQEQALDALVLLLEAEPDNALASYLLGMLYYRNNILDKAGVYLELSVGLDPNILTDELRVILNELE